MYMRKGFKSSCLCRQLLLTLLISDALTCPLDCYLPTLASGSFAPAWPAVSPGNFAHIVAE